MIKLPHKMRLLSTLLYYDKEEIFKIHKLGGSFI